MSQTDIAALVLFAFVTSVTPGPNNMMLLASGANFGLRRSLPHMLGVALGFVAMVALVGLGVMQLLAHSPGAGRVMSGAALVYLLWLAWKIAHAHAPKGRARARPFGFWQAVAFQWVNPKAWVMALSALAAYAPAHDLATTAQVAAIFGAVNLPSISLWAMMGRGAARLLHNPARLRAFNITMAVLLVASTLPALLM